MAKPTASVSGKNMALGVPLIKKDGTNTARMLIRMRRKLPILAGVLFSSFLFSCYPISRTF